MGKNAVFIPFSMISACYPPILRDKSCAINMPSQNVVRFTTAIVYIVKIGLKVESSLVENSCVAQVVQIKPAARHTGYAPGIYIHVVPKDEGIGRLWTLKRGSVPTFNAVYSTCESNEPSSTEHGSTAISRGERIVSYPDPSWSE